MLIGSPFAEVLAGLLAYLIGGVPFGWLYARAVEGVDLRTIGSGNVGATNAARLYKGRRAFLTFLLVLVLDAAKGFAAAWFAQELGRFLGAAASADTMAVVCGSSAIVGHVFTPYLGFKGGKGVATYIGVLLAWNWIVGLIFCAVWLVIALARRYSSLAAITAAATSPIFAYVVPGTGDLMLPAACGLMSVILMMTHWQNIHRLWKNTEPKIGEKKKVTQDN